MIDRPSRVRPDHERSRDGAPRACGLLAAVVACLVAIGSHALEVAAQESDRVAPEWLLGTFMDDYGIQYRIDEDQWRQGTEARYRVAEWNVAERYLIARNGADNPGEAGLWTRIDWVRLEPGSEFVWAFCYAVYDAASMEAARTAPSSARDAPRTGCNGHPFSRMRRPPSGEPADRGPRPTR